MSIKNEIPDGTITGSIIEDPTIFNLADGAMVKIVPDPIGERISLESLYRKYLYALNPALAAVVGQYPTYPKEWAEIFKSSQSDKTGKSE